MTAPVRLPTRKRTGRHIARAILFAYYTASRPGDALRASFLDGPGRRFGHDRDWSARRRGAQP